MKLLYCERCGDIVAPFRLPGKPRFCAGECHAVWWLDPGRGVLRLYENSSTAAWSPKAPGRDFDAIGKAWLRKRSPHAAWVIGLHNGFLKTDPLGKATIRALIEATPDTYIFRSWESLLIKVRPGESNDTDWAENLPELL